MGHGIGGIDIERSPEASDGLIEVARILEHIAQVVMQGGMAGIDRESAAQHLLRILASPERAQKAAGIVEGGDVIGPGAERLLEGGHGRGEIAELLVSVAEIVQGIGVSGTRVGGKAQIRGGLARPPEAAQGIAEVERSVGIAGLALEDGAQRRCGCREIAALIERDAQVDRMRGGPRIEGRGTLEDADRFIDIAHLPKRGAQVAQSNGVLGLEGESGTISRRGLCRPPAPLQGHTQRDVGLTRGRIIGQRTPVGVRCLVPALQGVQHLSEAELIAGIVGGSERSLPQRAERCVQPPVLKFQQAAAEQGQIMVGVRRQEQRIQPPCLR